MDRDERKRRKRTRKWGREQTHSLKRKKRERERRRAVHNGLILTFLWGSVLPVSYQMNGNCPADFNHVLNWQKNRRKALLRRLRIDRSRSRPIATLLYPPSHKHILWGEHTHFGCAAHFQTHTHAHTNMCTPMSEAIITVIAGGKEDKIKKDEGGRQGQEKNGRGESVEQWGASSHLGLRVSAVAADWDEG